MLPATAYVYVIFDPDGVPRYVGKGRRCRWLQHERGRSCNPHLNRIIAKAGGELPKVKIRVGLSDVEAFEVERALIRAIGRGKNGPLVNFTDGGDGLLNPSEAVRAKMSEKAKLRALSPEWRARISAKKKGQKLSDETRAKMSATHKGKKKTPEHQARINASLKGKPRPYMIARNKANIGVLRGPYPAEHRAAIKSGVSQYWATRRAAGLPMRHSRA